MRIAFLCGALEPGKDGVGDYVRQFARHLGAMGHQCMAIGVADSHTSVALEGTDPTTGLETVRLPADRWAAGDIGVAERALRRFSPDWTSLQMVCYSYERRGLLVRSPGRFAQLRVHGRRHMMFHELWIGESPDARPKDRLVGWLQKGMLLRTTAAWDPAVVHTSNPLYRDLLGRNGIQAMELPLPGNIPVFRTDSASARDWLLAQLATMGVAMDRSRPPMIAGVFGSIHPEWADQTWLERVSARCRDAGKQLIVIHFGRAGPRGAGVWTQLVHRFGKAVDFRMLGELSPEDVSKTLQALDLGISTSPWPLIGKSGAATAMLEHGIPTLVTRDDFRLRHHDTPEPRHHPLLYRLDESFVARLHEDALGKRPPRQETDVYRLFVQALAESA